MTRNEIIEGIYKDSQYLSYCKQVCNGGDLYNDLFQYVVLYLMEMNEAKLIALSESGGLRMYVARIIYINAKSDRSEFMKQYNGRIELPERAYFFEGGNGNFVRNKQTNFERIIKSEQYNDSNNFGESEEYDIEDVEEELRKEVVFCNSKNIYPASAKLLEIYAECGSYQEVANRTKIPYKTVRRHIITLREKIIKNINDKNTISNAG